MNSVDYPGLYQDAEAASSRAQKHYLWAVLSNIGLLVSSAVISLVEFSRAWSALFQTVALLGSLGITIYLALQAPHRVWYGTRALAETIKSCTWRFMMRSDPYHGDDAPARKRFVSDLGELIKDDPVARDATASSNSEQISFCMGEIRSRDTLARKKAYDIERLCDQLDWFRQKAQSNTRLAARWFVGLTALQCLAIGCALASFAFPDGPRWPVGVFAAAAAAVMAWLQAKRFQDHAASYSLAANELSLLRARMQDVVTDEELSSIVAETENGLSRELTRWRATRRGKEVG